MGVLVFATSLTTAPRAILMFETPLTTAAPGGGDTGPGYGGTSLSTVAVSNSGSKTFLFEETRPFDYVAGMRVRAVSNVSGVYLEGIITSFDAHTLIVSADRAVGCGSYDNWTLGLCGDG